MNEEKSTTEAAEEQHKTTDSRRYLKALTVVGYTSGLIFGPMVLFGGIGWWLSERFGTMLFTIGGLLVALIVSNFLIFSNTEKMLKKLK